MPRIPSAPTERSHTGYALVLGLEPITETPDHSRIGPAWSPDGSQVSYRDRDVGEQGTEGAFIVDLSRPWSEQTPEQLPAIGEPNEYFVAGSWSPDGKRIVGNKVNLELAGNQGIYVYDLQSRTYEQVHDSGGASGWLNDGRRMLFRTQDPSTLYLLDSQTGTSYEALSVVPNNLGGTAITEDNLTLFYNLVSLESDILQVSVN